MSLLFVGSADPANAQRAKEYSPPTLGVYDFAESFAKARDISVEHQFIAWQSFNIRDLRATVRHAKSNRRAMLLSVEPWTKAKNWVDGGGALFKAVLRGGYDKQIRRVCLEVKRMGAGTMVRWGHEMEEVTGRYPWARHDPKGYIAAYRYFVKKCRALAPRAKFVWSPIGHDGLEKYYPGHRFVDLIGLPVWGYQKADTVFYGHERTFAQALREKYDRVSRYNKPMIIAEIGVSGDATYRRQWFQDMVDPGPGFPLLSAVVYFNAKEPAEWPSGLGKPDWRATPALFNQRRIARTRESPPLLSSLQ